jgi:hypothetical protein
MHQTRSSRYPLEKSPGRRWYRMNVRFTIFSAVLRQQRKSDIITSFGQSVRSAIYYKAGSPLLQACSARLLPCREPGVTGNNVPWNKCPGTTDSNIMSLVSMYLNPSTNNKVGHLFQGDNHYCYTGGLHQSRSYLPETAEDTGSKSM